MFWTNRYVNDIFLCLPGVTEEPMLVLVGGEEYTMGGAGFTPDGDDTVKLKSFSQVINGI